MPTVVLPGSYWYDSWPSPTVRLLNQGNGTLDVSGGAGSVSVAPLGGTSQNVTYAFEVMGTDGDVTWLGADERRSSQLKGSGLNGGGSGTNLLSILTNGDIVGDIHVAGTLYLSVGGTIGTVSGDTVSVVAGGSIQSVTGRNVPGVTAGTSVGTVSATNDVGMVTAQTTVGRVTAGNDVHAVSAGASTGRVKAGSDVGTVSAGDSTDAVTAGGWVGTVTAGMDVAGDVTAGLWVGGAYAPGLTDEYAWHYSTEYHRGVSAGRDVVGAVTAGRGMFRVAAGRDVIGPVTAQGGDVWLVQAGGGNAQGVPYTPGRVVGPVSASRDVHFVSAQGDVTGSVTAAGGFVSGVDSGRDVAGAVTAQSDIGKWVTRPTDPDWREYLSPGPYWHAVYCFGGSSAGVRAGRVVSGAVTARTGDVTIVSAAAGSVDGSVQAGTDVGRVFGATGVDGSVAAGRDIGSVEAGVAGAVVWGGGIVGGPSDAGGTVLPPAEVSGASVVKASVKGNVTAGRDIETVSATGDMSGTVKARRGIRRVAAGGDISGGITAGWSVGATGETDYNLPYYNPYTSFFNSNMYSGVGVSAGGNLTGSVTAGADVSKVEAGISQHVGALAGSVTAGRDIGFIRGIGGVSAAIAAGRSVGRVYAGGWGNIGYYMTWGELPGVAPGDFTGSITTADEDVYGVYATGDVRGAVSAGKGILTVEARRSIVGQVFAGSSIGHLGPLTSEPGDSGVTQFWGGGVFAGVDVDSLISAGGDITTIQAGDNIAGSATAGRNVGNLTSRRGDIASAVTATNGSIGQVTAGTEDGGRVTGSLTAKTTIAGVTAYGAAGAAGGDILGLQLPEHGVNVFEGLETATWLTTDPVNDRYVRSALPERKPSRAAYEGGGDITAAIKADGNVGPVVAVGQITGSITSTAGAVGYLEAHPAVYPGPFGHTGGVWAYDQINGAISSATGLLVVRTWDQVAEASVVTAAGPLRVYGYGDVGGTLKSTAGTATAASWDDLTADVNGSEWVEAKAFVNIGRDGAASEGGKLLNSSSGHVRAWAGGIVSSSVKATKYAAVFAKGSISTSEASSASEDTYVETKDGDIVVQGSLGSSNGGARAKDLVWLTAGRDINAAGVTSSQGSVVADAGRAVIELFGSADKNVWAAARDGGLTAHAQAVEGWAYAWAATDVKGTITAKRTTSVTAWKDVDAVVKSTDDVVEVFGGTDVKGEVSGAQRAEVEGRGTVSATIKAGFNGYEGGDASVWAGADVTGKITAAGEANVVAKGSVRTDITATSDDVIVTAEGDITGVMQAGMLAEIMAGGSVGGSVVAEEEVNIEGTTGVSAQVESKTASASVWSGTAIGGSVKAGYEAIVEAVGAITATVTTDYTASILAGGNISGRVEAEWLADVRSAAGEVTGQVVTRKGVADRLSDAKSPTRRRLAVIDAQLQDMADDPHYSPAARQALEVEKEIHNLQNQSLDFQSIPAARVRAMIAEGLAKEETGGPLVMIVDHPFYPNQTQELKGYVVIADVVGTEGYVMILEPYREWVETVIGPNGYQSQVHDESCLGHPQDATEYRVVKRESFADVTHTTDPAEFRQQKTTPGRVRLYAEVEGGKKMESQTASVLATLEFAMHLVPLAGAVDEFTKGNYLEAGISLASDATMFIGLGAAVKGAKCAYAGSKVVKLAARTTAAIEGGIVATRMGQGFHALNSPNPEDRAKAWGYFGDATLRLFGLSAQAVQMMKKPMCFVAGTPVHTDRGPVPIENVLVGDRVWAFDRRVGEWRLCPVTHTFERRSSELSTVRLVDRASLVGTAGHPVWVIEGAGLPTRPYGDHGEDETTERTPGRWVALGAVQVGDAVLTRGGATRVTSAGTEISVVSVYNLTVDDLHCYAAGEAGVLSHNVTPGTYPDPLPDLARTKSATRTKPKVETEAVPAVPEKTPPGAADAKAVTAPKNKTTKPEKAAKKRTHAPNTNKDPRVGPEETHQWDRSSDLADLHGEVPAGGKLRKVRDVPTDERTPELDAKLREWQRQKESKGTPHAESDADPNHTLGEAGKLAADGYMTKHLGPGGVNRTPPPSGNGNYEFDSVYQKGDTYYVVEAKAGKYGRETSRQTGELNAKGEPVFAMQGSPKYMDMTIKDMVAAGGSKGKLGEDLQSALANQKVVYLNVHTKLTDVGDVTSDLRQTIKRYKVD